MAVNKTLAWAMRAVSCAVVLTSASGSQIMCTNDADYAPDATASLSGFAQKCSNVASKDFLSPILDKQTKTECLKTYQVFGMFDTNAAHMLSMVAHVCCKGKSHKCSAFVTNVCVDPSQYNFEGQSSEQGGCPAVAGAVPVDMVSNGTYTGNCNISWLADSPKTPSAAKFFNSATGCCGDKGVLCYDAALTGGGGTSAATACKQDCVTTTGTLSLTMSKEHAAAITANSATAKTVLQHAIAKVAGIDSAGVTVKSVSVDGTTITAAWEIKHEKAVAPSKFSEDTLKAAIDAEAQKEKVTITTLTATVTVTSGSGSSKAGTTSFAKGLSSQAWIISALLAWLTTA